MPSPLKRTFSLVKFPTRSSSSNQIPSDVYESRYTRSEDQRRDAFQASLNEFQQEFQAEEEARSAGENARQQDFDRAMANFRTTFLQNLSHRKVAFQESDSRHEDIFWKADAAREIVFSQGQLGRADAFKSDQEARTKSSEGSSIDRKALYLEGRQRAKDTCAALDRILVEQFDRMMKSQEDEFIADEHRRDELVRKHLHEQQRPPSSGPTTTTIGHEASEPESNPSFTIPSSIPPPTAAVPLLPHIGFIGIDEQPSPALCSRQLPPSRPTGPRRSRSPSFTGPITVGRPLPPVVASPSPSPSARQLSPEPESEPGPQAQSGPEPLKPKPSPAPEAPSESKLRVKLPTSPLRGSVSEGSNTPASKYSSPVANDLLDRLFIEAQNGRQNTFLKEEMDRESSFFAAEAERDAAELERATAFDRKADTFSATAQKLLASQDERFRGREEARLDVDRLCETAFESAQRQHFQAFETSVTHMEKQAEAEDMFEELFMDRQRSITLALLEEQVMQLSAARDDRRRRFAKAQQRRSEELGAYGLGDSLRAFNTSRHPPIRRPPPPGGPSVSVLSYETSANPNDVPQSMSGMDVRMNMRRSSQHLTMRSQPPIVAIRRRSTSPGTGFSPSTLIKGAVIPKGKLPVPQSSVSTDIEALLTELRQELDFVNLQRRRQAIFERSEAQRDEDFEHAARVRRQIFKASEAKRVFEFVKAQSLRAKMFEEAEDRREEEFEEAQQLRERQFQENERSREKQFQRSELARDARFRDAQEGRARRFYSVQQRIQKQCFENEKRRHAEMDKWGKNLVTQREKEQRDIAQEDREAFASIFSLLQTPK